MFSLFRSVGIATWAWRTVLSCSMRPRIWLPFLVIAAVELLTLGLLVSFHRPVLQDVLVPMITGIAGDGATHYPFHFWALPLLFSRFGIFIAVIIGSLAVGAATLHFANTFGHQSSEAPWRLAMRRYPALLTLSVLLALTIYGLSELRGAIIPVAAIRESSMVRWGTRGTMLLLFVLIQSFLVYGAAWILIKGENVLSAARNSFRLTARTFLPTFLIVAAPALIQLPLSFLTNQASVLGDKFRPEMVSVLLVSGIGLQLLLGFFLVGAVTRVFLLRLEERI